MLQASLQRLTASLFALAMTSACAEPSLDVYAKPPSDTAWIATAWLSGTGEVLGATPLERWTPGRALRGQWATTGPDFARVVVLGFSAERLASVALPADDVLASEPLRAARAIDPVLPLPTWTGAGAVSDGTADVEDQALTLELTASWLPRCPTFVPSGARAKVDVDCTQIFCDASIEQRECGLFGSLSACGIDVDSVPIDGRGHGAMSGCELVPALPGASAALQCQECRVELYAPPYPDPFVVEEVAVLDVAPSDASVPAKPIGGYIAGATTMGDRVVLVTHDGRGVGARCTETASTSLHLFDPDALTELARVPAPPCLGALAGSDERGFFGIFGGDVMEVGRFDATGRLVARAVIPDVTQATHFRAGLVVTADGRRVVAGLSAWDEEGKGRLVVFDAASLAFERAIDAEPRILSMLPTASTEVAIGIDPGSRVHFFDVAAGTGAILVDPAAGQARVDKSPDFLAKLPGDARLFASTFTENGELHVVSAESGWIRTVETWEMNAAPTVLTPWSARAATFLASTVVSTTHEAEAVLVDAENIRYLPGMTKIGLGPALAILHLAGDAIGRQFVVLPWSAKLVRITPR